MKRYNELDLLRVTLAHLSAVRPVQIQVNFKETCLRAEILRQLRSVTVTIIVRN